MVEKWTLVLLKVHFSPPVFIPKVGKGLSMSVDASKPNLLFASSVVKAWTGIELAKSLSLNLKETVLLAILKITFESIFRFLNFFYGFSLIKFIFLEIIKILFRKFSEV